MAKQALGRGLEALMPKEQSNVAKKDEENGILEIPLKDIKPNRYQPRKEFAEEQLTELAASITASGVIQPIIVIKKGKGYELVAGERRTRAAKLAGLEKIPAIIKEYTDEQLSEIALIENIQRENLNPLEEAEAYERLMKEFNLTQANMAEKVGKSRSHIANTLRLLELSGLVKKYLSEGKLSAGHARAMLSLNTNQQELLAEKVVRKGLSVREVENIIKDEKTKKSGVDKRKDTSEIPLEIMTVKEELEKIFATKVRIDYGKEKGKIEIEYYSEDELARIVDILLGN